MTPRRRAILLTLALVIGVASAGVFGYMQLMKSRGLGVPAHLVPPSWSEFKTSAGHRTHVDKEGIACKKCHAFETEGFKNPSAAVCTSCHAKETSHAHGGGATTAATGNGDCVSCHAFAPNKEVPTCISCHKAAQKTVALIGTHATVDCKSCHTPHGDSATALAKRIPNAAAKSAACTSSCHQDVKSLASVHARVHAGKDSAGCADCHKPHASAVAAKKMCATCHEQPAGPKPAGHDSCFDCHKPHDLAGGAGLCIGCHGVKPTLVATRVPAHAVCTSCHTAHAPAGASGACQRCHSVEVVHGGKSACVGCHQPHSGDPNAKATACTTCHAKVAVAAFGGAAHAKGVACASCHSAHDVSPPSPTSKRGLCTHCHASEVTLVATNAGHADCTKCHGAATHQPSRASACASCHAKEASTAPAGHQRCASCHENHSGAKKPDATCASCHAREVASKHGSATPAGCATCHRAHGPSGVASSPSCTTCHAKPKLAGLHASPSHAECAKCHTTHAAPRADRASCTSGCHADKRDHQPQAAVCNGCHVFRR